MIRKYMWHPVVELFDSYKTEIALGNCREFEKGLLDLDDFSYEKKDISNIGNIVLGNLESIILTQPVFLLIAHAKSTAGIISNQRKNIYDMLFHGEDEINDIPHSQIKYCLDDVDKRYKKILENAKRIKGTRGNIVIANIHKLMERDDYFLFKSKKEMLLNQILLAKS